MGSPWCSWERLGAPGSLGSSWKLLGALGRCWGLLVFPVGPGGSCELLEGPWICFELLGTLWELLGAPGGWQGNSCGQVGERLQPNPKLANFSQNCIIYLLIGLFITFTSYEYQKQIENLAAVFVFYLQYQRNFSSYFSRNL